MSVSQIADWKAEYGEVYSANMRGVEYIFRGLTLEEHHHITSDQSVNSTDIEDFVVMTCLLSPAINSLDDIPFGAISALFEEILNVSGFGDPKFAKRVLDTKRQEATQVLGLMKAFILSSIPVYTEEDLNLMTFTQLAWKVALAEQIIQIKRAMVPAVAGEGEVTLHIVDPEEEAAALAAHEKAEREKWEKLAARGKVPTSDEKGPSLKPKIKANDPIADKLRKAMGG